MKSYLSNLNERERWTLIGGLICVVLYGYYLFLYEPLSSKVKLKSTQLHEKASTLTWMQQVRLEHRNSPKKQTVSNSQLLTVLANQLKESTLRKFPYQLQQASSGEIQLTFDEVPFNPLIEWLTQINEQYALAIKQFDASKLETPGIIKLAVMINAV